MSARTASAAAAALILLGGLAPPAAPAKLAEIPDTAFLAEGVAVSQGGIVLVSGVQGRTVVKLKGGRVSPWLKGQTAGGLFGMEIDRHRNRLWVAETGGDGVPGSTGPRASAVLEVRLSDGAILARRPAPADGKNHWIGDLVLAPDGTVYASDSEGGDIYRLRPGGRALDLVAHTGLESLQGLALSAGGAGLIVADYGTGLHRVELADGKVGPALPAEGEVRGLDALERRGADLIATQNGTSRHRVLRLKLAQDEKRISSVDILAVGAPLLEDVSLGAVDGDRFVFVARSGWAGFDDKGRSNGKPARPSVIATVGLPPG